VAKLWAFGCSMTYGTALSDCVKIHPITGHITHGHYPSKLAWPSVLSKILDLTCINKGIPGSSNKAIWHEVLRHLCDFEKDDKIFVLWSYKDRHCVINNTTNRDRMYTHIGPWQTDKRSRYYYKHLHSDYEVNMDLNLRQSHLDLIFKEKGLTAFQLICRRDANIHGHRISDQKGAYTAEPWNEVKMLDTEFDQFRHEFAKAEDGLHPDEHCHAYMAKLIAEEINTVVGDDHGL